MKQRLVGLAILVVAVAACWAVVALGQAQAMGIITRVIGPARAGSDAATVETLFNAIIFVPLIAIALVAAAVERRNALAPGRRQLAALGLGLATGLAGLSVAVLYAKLAGTLTAGDPVPVVPGMLAWGLGIVALQTAAEEIYFRGWLQPALTARWGQVAGVVAGALAFGALHVAGGARAPISLVNLFAGGLMFGLFAARSGGIAAALGAHLAWNGAEQLAYGLDPNPGIGGFGSWLNWELAGNPIWGGSDQGLNGSIGMTVALLAIIAPLALLPWRARGQVAAKPAGAALAA